MRQNVQNVSRQCDGIWYQDEPCPNCRTRGMATAIYGNHLPKIPAEMLELLGMEPIHGNRLYIACNRCGLLSQATAEQQERYESTNAPNLDLDDYDA